METTVGKISEKIKNKTHTNKTKKNKKNKKKTPSLCNLQKKGEQKPFVFGTHPKWSEDTPTKKKNLSHFDFFLFKKKRKEKKRKDKKKKKKPLVS